MNSFITNIECTRMYECEMMFPRLVTVLVCFHMCRQRPCLREGFVTDVTRVRLLSGVNSQMNF